MNKKLLSLLLILSMVLSLFSPSDITKATNNATQSANTYGTGALSPEEEAKLSDAENVTHITTKEEMYEYLENYNTEVKDQPNATGDETSNPAANELPSSVDNSTSAYFPPIRSQGSIGSCTAWAMAYYQLTYELNRAKSQTASDTSNQISAMFLYNLINNGYNIGTSAVDASYALSGNGSCSYDLGPSTYDYKSWSATEEVWKNAQANRINGSYTIGLNPNGYSTYITGPKDSDLDALKTALVSGNILSFSTAFYTFSYDTIRANSAVPGNNPYIGQTIVKSCDNYEVDSYNQRDYGYHRMTLVGYNDDIWIDLNGNGIVEENEKGAFKIANSHGTDYANNGFTWFSYDALNQISSVPNVPNENRYYDPMYTVYAYQVFPATRNSQLYVKFTFNTARRNEMRVKIKATKGSTTKEYSPRVFTLCNSGQLSFDGSTDPTDGTFVFDLNSVISDISVSDLADYTWSAEIQDYISNSYPLTVKEITILDERNNKSYSTNITTSTLNGSSATYAINTTVPNDTENKTTIYYKGYSNPYIHYQIANGAWTSVPGVKMTATNELSGYTHKATISLGSNTTLTACFNDGNGNWDSRNGANYSFGTGAYTYSNGVITKISSPDPTPTPTPTSTPIVTPTPTTNPNGNKTTIYYKGYSPAYMHYRIGNGNWTNAPGVAMQSSTEQTGYTHKITIDLGTENTLTACFNNGNGSWDSDNGKNYTFGTGTYGYSNGNIVELNDNLRVTAFNTNTSTGGTYTELTFNASAAGGTAPYEYRFGYIKSGAENTIMSYSSKSTASWTPSVAGTYDFFVDVKDANQTIVRKSISNFVIEGLKVASLTTDVASPQKTGASIIITGKATNAKPDPCSFYNYSVTKNGVTQDLKTNTNNTATWTPTEKGTYTITFTFSDYLANKVTKSMEYVITDVSTNQTTIYYKGYSTPYIHYKIGNGNWTNVPGVLMTATTEMSGYTHKMTIDLADATNLTVCFNDGNGNWDSRNGVNYSFGVGTYTYSNGTITKIN